MVYQTWNQINVLQKKLFKKNNNCTVPGKKFEKINLIVPKFVFGTFNYSK